MREKLSNLLLLTTLLLGNLVQCNGKIQAQEKFTKNEIILKLDDFINEYRKLSNFSPEFIHAKTKYVSNYISLFKNPKEQVICNDLPLLFKENRIITPYGYCELLFAEFENGLVADISFDSVEVKSLGNEIWKAEIIATKTFYGSFPISENNIIHHLKIDLLYENRFKIIQITNIGDIDIDGVKDVNDICKNEYGFHKFDGCPDSDLDNVPDLIDRCPDSPEGQLVNKFGCYKYYYEDAGFMEVDINPTMVINSNTPIKPSFGVRYGVSLVKAITGNYKGRVHALKTGGGVFKDAFYAHDDSEIYASDAIFYSLGYRKYSNSNNFYQGVGINLILDFATYTNKGKLSSLKDESIGFYAEFGYMLKIENGTYLNVGTEFLYYNNIHSSKTVSQTLLNIKTSFMLNLE